LFGRRKRKTEAEREQEILEYREFLMEQAFYENLKAEAGIEELFRRQVKRGVIS
jgi:hypothetical protein